MFGKLLAIVISVCRARKLDSRLGRKRRDLVGNPDGHPRCGHGFKATATLKCSAS
jgi:hypothetical protein